MMATIGFGRLWISQFLFWSAGAVFANPMEKRENFKQRCALFAVIVVIYTVVFQRVLWDGNHAVERMARVVSTILMAVFIYGGWKISVTTAIYNSIWAVTLWQVLDEVWYALETIGKDYFAENPDMLLVGMLILYTVVYFIIGRTIGRWMPMDRNYNIGPRQTLSAVLIFAIIQVLGSSEELRHITEYTSEWKFLYISQILCIVILYLQNEMFKKSAIREELTIMNMLWKNKQEQYELSKENIALINQKSHDLKHQVRALRKLNTEEFDKFLDEMEESVQIYESIVKTGNENFCCPDAKDIRTAVFFLLKRSWRK